ADQRKISKSGASARCSKIQLSTIACSRERGMAACGNAGTGSTGEATSSEGPANSRIIKMPSTSPAVIERAMVNRVGMDFSFLRSFRQASTGKRVFQPSDLLGGPAFRKGSSMSALPGHDGRRKESVHASASRPAVTLLLVGKARSE